MFNEGGAAGAAGEVGSKRSLSWFKRWLDANGHSSRQGIGLQWLVPKRTHLCFTLQYLDAYMT